MRRAIQRFEDEGDILFTEGGVVQSAALLERLSYIPGEAVRVPEMMDLKRVFTRSWSRDPCAITGCVLSGLLSARYPHIAPTVGAITLEASRMNYDKLKELGFQAADLHCREYRLPERFVLNFRQRYGVKDERSKT